MYSVNVATTEFSKMDAGWGTDSFFVDSIISIHNDGYTSSVGSCSIIGNDAYNLLFRFSLWDSDNIEGYYSDVESNVYSKFESNWSLVSIQVALKSYLTEFKDYELLGPNNWS